VEMNFPCLNPRHNISAVDFVYGDGGSRTRVRRLIDKDFYHHSRFICVQLNLHLFPIPTRTNTAKGFGSFLIFYRFKATGGKVPHISRPGFRYAGLPEPTTALVKPQMRIVYCRFFFRRFGILSRLPSADGYPYFQNPRRNHYVPVWLFLCYVQL